MRRKVSLWIILVFLLLAACGEVPTAPSPLGQSPLPTLRATATMIPPSPPQGYPPLTPSPTLPAVSPAPTSPDSGRIRVVGEVQLTNEGWTYFPTWSPDGSRIAYYKLVQQEPNRICELWVMNADGSSPARVADNVPGLKDPSWSPDGGKLLYVSGSVEGPNEVTIADLGRGEQTTVASGSIQGAAWVTEGRVSFVRDGRLVLIDPSTGTEEVWEELEFTMNWQETDFIVSPDGRKLAYLDGRKEPGGYFKGLLWIVDLETRKMIRANSDQDKISPGRHRSVSWSPDSHLLAYVTGGALSKLWSADAATGSFVLLLQQEGSHFDCPTWSPDGRVLAFTSTPTGSSTAPYMEIYLLNWDGSGLRRLTENEQEEECPSWSPDGSEFIFTRPPSRSTDEGEKHFWVLLLRYD